VLTTYADRLESVRARVCDATRAAGRDPRDVTVLLATKTQSADVIRTVLSCPAATGMARGENRVQELAAKGPDLADLDVPTHLIGPLQSNKIHAALRWVSCLESVASQRVADAVASRVEPGRTVDVMVQVNVSGEPTKHGVAPRDALRLARHIAGLPALRLTGFMTIGAHTDDMARVAAGYARLRTIRDDALADGISTVIHLSMGMSGDLETAITEGATVVRVGTAVFGPRGA
jgi:pyridoxal phosphate enzyme (YggS family)